MPGPYLCCYRSTWNNHKSCPRCRGNMVINNVSVPVSTHKRAVIVLLEYTRCVSGPYVTWKMKYLVLLHPEDWVDSDWSPGGWKGVENNESLHTVECLRATSRWQNYCRLSPLVARRLRECRQTTQHSCLCVMRGHPFNMEQFIH